MLCRSPLVSNLRARKTDGFTHDSLIQTEMASVNMRLEPGAVRYAFSHLSISIMEHHQYLHINLASFTGTRPQSGRMFSRVRLKLPPLTLRARITSPLSWVFPIISNIHNSVLFNFIGPRRPLVFPSWCSSLPPGHRRRS